MMGTCLPGEQEHRARTQSSENKKSSKEDGAEETVDAITQGLEYALGILVSRRTRQKDMSAHNPGGAASGAMVQEQLERQKASVMHTEKTRQGRIG
jgi:hypothetical protein